VAAHLGDRLGELPLRLIDLGDTGARVETSAWLAPGNYYLLRIDDPPFRITGRVVHARLLRVDSAAEGIRPVFEAGLDFEDAWPAARNALAQLMQRLADLALDCRLPDLYVASR
jgi:hypothetical protein